MHASSPDGDRGVTFDRAVWTKPLAFAADAVSSAMGARSCGPRMWGRAARCGRADQGDDDIAAVPDLRCVGGDVDGRANLRRMRGRARPTAAGEAGA
jgi:hypothetical protein